MKVSCSRRSSASASRPAFTLVELLMVIVVIGMLAALLLPAIAAAIRKAREASVSSEIQQLAQALADFKSRYGDYPPSRVLLCEDGNYAPYLTGVSATSTIFATPNAADQPTAALAARSLSSLRKFWPRVRLGTTGATYTTATGWPDFNGDGLLSGPVVLSGDECLLFFLGGVPQAIAPQTPGGKPAWIVTGFSRDPSSPFPSANAGGVSRSAPYFEFRTDRLADPDGDGYPSYLDSLGTGRPYAYFSSYGGGAYDPNDVNFDVGPLAEPDDSGATPTLAFAVPFPVKGSGVAPYRAVSPPPNPYAATTTTAVPVGWMAPQTFQILSAGVDGMYGVGGLYSSSANEVVPFDPVNTTPANDVGIRVRERDNLTSFHGGRLD